MIQAGKHIATTGDELHKIQMEYLFHAIRKPNIEIQNKIRQLRIVRNINNKQYVLLKKQLPYFVCGIFNPNIRRTENFAYTSYFVIDIDHISEKGIDISELRNKIEADIRVLLCFISPGEDGLKIVFKLSERCYDPGIYSLFYKQFVVDFSRQYNLEQVTDSRTSDVTRACFVSYDPNVYYNSEAENINLNSFVDVNNPYGMFQKKRKLEKEEKDKQKDVSDQSSATKLDVDNEVIQNIKTILSNKPKAIEKPAAYVPEQLDEIIDDLKNYIMSTGTIVQEIKNIHYGKKIKVAVGYKLGEINIFYGKRGFSVIISPRTGTSPEINEMIASLIESFFMKEVN